MISKTPPSHLRVGLLFACALFLFSCSTGEEDLVYIKIFNGYAGGGAVSVFGPEGAIATDIPFGQDSGAAIPVDRRNFDGTLTASFDGVPRLVPLNADLFSLYPDETATLFFTRRSGAGAVSSMVLRHTHLANNSSDNPPSSKSTVPCVTEFHNGLSVGQNIGSDPSTFNISTQWYYPDIRDADYLGIESGEPELNIESPCGPVKLDDPNLKGTRDIIAFRKLMYNVIKNDTWFYLVEGEEQGLLSYRYGNISLTNFMKPDATRNFAPPGQIYTYLNTTEFVKCVEDSLELEVEMSGGLGGAVTEPECVSEPDGSVSPPVGADGVYKMEFDEEALEECLKPVLASPVMLLAGSEGTSFIKWWAPSRYSQPQNRCQAKIRLRTSAVDSVFDVGDYEDGGFDLPTEANGPIAERSLVEVDILAPRDTWSYVVIYGRPIQPFVYQMFGSYEAQNFSRITYPGGANPPEENPRKNPLFGN